MITNGLFKLHHRNNKRFSHNFPTIYRDIDTGRFKSYRLLPADGDLKDYKADFPQGKYESPFIPVAMDKEDLNSWLFVVADHQCSNGPIYNGLGISVSKPSGSAFITPAKVRDCNQCHSIAFHLTGDLIFTQIL